MSADIRHVAVVGAGGMGALFGAILAEGGLAVTLVDTDHDHIDAIRRDGLRISGHGGERSMMIAAEHDVARIKAADIVLVQCKGTATRAAALSMRHLADQGTIFISFQNGLGNEDILAEILGAENVLGGLTSMAGARTGLGTIRDFDRVPSYIGEWASESASELANELASKSGGKSGGKSGDMTSPRAAAIAATLTAAGLETHASANIKTDIWKKLLGNMAMSAVSGVTNLTSTEILQIESLRRVCFTALDEAISIAHSQNIDLDRDTVVRGLELMTAPGGTGDNKSSLCLDVLSRRPSEVEFIYGTPLQLADAAGLAVPTLRSLYGLVKGMETHYVGADDETGAG